jgi:hypothetical protein
VTRSVVDPRLAKPGEVIGYRKDGRPIRLIAGGHTNPNFEQRGFRARAGDTALLNAAFGGSDPAVNTHWSQDADVTFRVRFAVEEDAGGTGTVSGQLEASLNGGAFFNVTTTSTIVKAVASSQYAHDATTSDLNIGGAGGFVAGRGSETGDTTDVTLTSQHTEFEYALQIVSTDVANGNTIELRLAGLNLYTFVPTVTVTGVTPPPTNLVIANAAHDHVADNVTVTTPTNLVVNDAAQAHTAQSPTLTEPPSGDDVAWNAEQVIWDGLVATWAAAGGATDLVIANATHAHAADSPSLTQAHSLTADAATHVHSAENVTLAVESTLTIANASQGHTAEQVTLSIEASLGIANATHAHSAESPNLAVIYDLAVDVAVHGHTADNLTLLGAGDLDIHNVVHGQVAAEPTLTQLHLLVAANATHTHTASNVSLSGGSELGINSALHSHTVDSPSLGQAHVLAAASAEHAHTAGAPVLTQTHILAIDDALHGHSADVVVLTLGVIVTPAGRTLAVAREIRTLAVNLARILAVGIDVRVVLVTDARFYSSPADSRLVEVG